jgi:hypothetical protein
MQCKAASFLQARCENNCLNKKMKTPFKNRRIYAAPVLFTLIAWIMTIRIAHKRLIFSVQNPAAVLDLELFILSNILVLSAIPFSIPRNALLILSV